MSQLVHYLAELLSSVVAYRLALYRIVQKYTHSEWKFISNETLHRTRFHVIPTYIYKKLTSGWM